MRRPLTAAMAALVLAAPLTTSSAPAVAAACTAAPELVSASVSPALVVLGTSLPKGFVLTAAVRANGCTVADVDVEVATPSGSTSFAMAEEETTDGVTTYDVGVRVDPGDVGNADAGPWTSRVSISRSGATSQYAGPSVRVLRATRLSINATPEPVRAGKKLTVRGALSRASWTTPHYAGYTKAGVDLQFRPRRGAYTTVKTLTSGRHGTIKTTLTAKQDGCYRLIYRGSVTNAPVVATPDCVDVR